MGRLPSFVIIGSMKSATSTLHDQLAAQPGVFMSDPKEPCFFSDDDVYARGMSWYSSLFENAPADALCGESSTHYTKLPTHPHAAKRLAEALPDAKLVYVMRHPIDRLVSHYVHAWTEREVSVRIDRAIETHPQLIDYSCYASQLEAYLAHFDRRAILPVFFERLRAEGPTELERVARFLGYNGPVTWDAARARQNVSAHRLRKSPVRDALVNAPLLRQLRRHLVPRRVRDQAKRIWQLRERPHLSEASRAQLVSAFDPELDRLGRWLGVHLSCDNFVETVTARALSWGPNP